MTELAPAGAGPTETQDWDGFVAEHPLATYLQVSAWARVKAANGWSSLTIESARGSGRIGAQVLLRRPMLAPWTFAYAPRGPLATHWSEAAASEWTDAARESLAHVRTGLGAISHLRIDPEIEIDGPRDRGGNTTAILRRLGWQSAPEIQPSVTRLVDLTAGEAALWSDLRKKWRQYVNRARSQGVVVVDVDADADRTAWPTFHQVMTETSRRTGLPIRTEAAYRDIWNAFRPRAGARLLFARDRPGTAQAVLLLVRCGTRVVEPYGGMTAAGAESRANYLLKWEAIRSSREHGATSYDMWGLVHPGIRQFKEGFGGREVQLIGAWDLSLDRVGSALYRLVEGRRRAPRVISTNGV